MVQALVSEFVAGFRDGWAHFWGVTAWPFRLLKYLASRVRRTRH